MEKNLIKLSIIEKHFLLEKINAMSGNTYTFKYISEEIDKIIEIKNINDRDVFFKEITSFFNLSLDSELKFNKYYYIAKTAKNTNVIKNWVVFFGILMVISIISNIIFYAILLSH